MDLSTQDRVKQVKADHAKLIADGHLPEGHDPIAYAALLKGRTLEEIREEHAENGGGSNWSDYLATFLNELKGGDPLFHDPDKSLTTY